MTTDANDLNRRLAVDVGGTFIDFVTLDPATGEVGIEKVRSSGELHRQFTTGMEQLGVDAEQVTEGAKFVDDLGADSLDVVELVMAFEEEFGIEIPDEDAEKIAKVEDAVSYIEGAAKGDG